MLRKTTWAALLGVATLTLAACDTMDGDGKSDAQRAYDACQPYHQDKRQGLGKSWAFVSGVGDDGSSGCRWSYNYPNAASAAKAATDGCRKTYSRCWVFATSDGLSSWVRTMSDNIGAGRNPNYGLPGYAQNSGGGYASNGDSDNSDNNSDDDGSSLGDFLTGLADLLNGITGVVEATQGGGGGGGYSGGGPVSIPSSNGYSQKGAFDDCAKLYSAIGDTVDAKKCEDRSTNMHTR